MEITKSLIKVASKIIKIGSNVKVKYVKDRPGHDFRYALNSGKIKKYLGWKSKIKFEMESGPTIEWLINKHNIPLELDPDWGAKLGHSKPRIHSTPTKTGVELMSCLQNACEKSNIDILKYCLIIGVV